MRKPRTKRERTAAKQNGEIIRVLRFMAHVKGDVEPEAAELEAAELEAGRLLYTPREHASLVALLRKLIHALYDTWYGAAQLDVALDRIEANPCEIQDLLDEALKQMVAVSTKPQ
jgi:hypothetical protein